MKRHAIAAGVALLALMPLPAAAYDYDQQWVRQTIHGQKREAWLAERRHKPVKHYSKPKPATKRHHHHEKHADTTDGTRVYGVAYRAGRTIRDATANVQCWPPLENTSREHSNEDRAWNDAQLGWMASVASKYGARFADVQNIDLRTLERRCFRATFDESWLARNLEAAAQNTGTGLGYKLRCTIIAAPCMAPASNATPLKGDIR